MTQSFNASANQNASDSQADLSGQQREFGAKLGAIDYHWHFFAVMVRKPTDFEPYGFRVRDGADCSCGCKWFLPLVCAPADWGVCSNPVSPRSGLLTFEHQGCPQYEPSEEQSRFNEEFVSQHPDLFEGE